MVAISSEVTDEISRAVEKFPHWPNDPLHAVVIVGEEFGELSKAVLQMTYEPHKVNKAEIREEAVQTAAMLMRFIASLDKYEYQPSGQHTQAGTKDTDINVGDRVQKVGGDYTFVGVVLDKFKKTSGAIRYVVEDDRGTVHIFSAKMLELVD